MEISDWFPLIAALLALVGVWWSIRAAKNREHEQWRRDQAVRIGSELLQQSVSCREVLNTNVPEAAAYADQYDVPQRKNPPVKQGFPPLELRQEVWANLERLKKLVATFSFVADDESIAVARSLLSEHSGAYAMTNIMTEYLRGNPNGTKSTPKKVATDTIDGVKIAFQRISRNENLLVLKLRANLGLKPLPSGYGYSVPSDLELHEF